MTLREINTWLGYVGLVLVVALGWNIQGEPVVYKLWIERKRAYNKRTAKVKPQ